MKPPPPIDIEMTSTPSCIAASKAARISISEHPLLVQQTLYMATLADGTPPRAVPSARPERLAPAIALPVAVDDVWVPWPSVSTGDKMSEGSGLPSSLKYLAPISFLDDIRD